MFKSKESILKFTSMALKYRSNILVKLGRKYLQICIYPSFSKKGKKGCQYCAVHTSML